MKSIKNHTIAALSLTLLFGAGFAVADGGTSEPAQEVQQQQQNGEPAKERPLLAGPKVEDEAKETAGVSRMGEQMRPAQPPVIQLMQWMRLVRSLDLTDEQVEKIDAIAEAQRRAMRKFMEEHGEALQAIQSEMREARQAQDREKMQELMGKMRELREKGPRPERIQNAVWGVLHDEQQEALREKIAELRKEREQRLRERAGQSDGGAAEGMSGGEGDEAMSDRPVRRRPAAGDRPGRQRGEGAPPARRGDAAEGERRRQRGVRPDDSQREQPPRERRRGAPRP